MLHQLRQLWSVRRLSTKDAAKTLVHASILSRIDYCNSVLSRVCAVHLRPLHSVLHSAARLILRIRKYDRISATIREVLHWLPVHHRIRFKTCALVHKCLRTWTRTFVLNRHDRVGRQGACMGGVIYVLQHTAIWFALQRSILHALDTLQEQDRIRPSTNGSRSQPNCPD